MELIQKILSANMLNSPEWADSIQMKSKQGKLSEIMNGSGLRKTMFIKINIYSPT